MCPFPSRFGHSNLHQRDPRSALFEGYNPPGGNGPNRQQANASPNRYGSYGYVANGGTGTPGLGPGTPSAGYRPATPNRKGQYSDAVLNELESQNDSQVEGILGKVKVLKDVISSLPPPLPCFATSLVRRNFGNC